jgi:cation transport ATPase
MLTGEPTPFAKAAGDRVIGASINRSSTCPCALGLATPSSIAGHAGSGDRPAQDLAHDLAHDQTLASPWR